MRLPFILGRRDLGRRLRLLELDVFFEAIGTAFLVRIRSRISGLGGCRGLGRITGFGAAGRRQQFVRGLEAVMLLPAGKSRKEFARRLAVFASGTNVSTIADDIYRLRSLNEHMSDWPEPYRESRRAN